MKLNRDNLDFILTCVLMCISMHSKRGKWNHTESVTMAITSWNILCILLHWNHLHTAVWTFLQHTNHFKRIFCLLWLLHALFNLLFNEYSCYLSHAILNVSLRRQGPRSIGKKNSTGNKIIINWDMSSPKVSNRGQLRGNFEGWKSHVDLASNDGSCLYSPVSKRTIRSKWCRAHLAPQWWIVPTKHFLLF